jgi:hypothetical protein
MQARRKDYKPTRRFRGKELIRVWQSRLKEERNRPKNWLAGKEQHRSGYWR